MARLIRMDGPATRRSRSGPPPTTPPSTRPSASSREQHEPGLHRHVPDGPGKATHVRELPREADLVIMRRPIAGGLRCPRRARPARLPELAAVPWRQRDRRRAGCAAGAGSGRLDARSTRCRSSPPPPGMLWLEPLAAPVALAALAHAWIIPELYAFRGASVVRPKGAAPTPARAGGAGPARRPARPRRARAAARHRARARARDARRLAGRARPARCWSRRAAGGCTASACAPPSASCRRPTASPTCCWRCARTRRASPPWPTTPSPARPGGCAAGCPRRCAPGLDAAAVRSDACAE